GRGLVGPAGALLRPGAARAGAGAHQFRHRRDRQSAPPDRGHAGPLGRHGSPRGGQAVTDPVLSIRNLNIDYIGAETDFHAVRNVSFEIAQGELFGLAGESGCGKSTIAFAISRLHRPPALIRKGSQILVGGRDVLALDDDELRRFRWSEVAMVFQSAMNSLNPVLTIETQFYDVLRTHRGMSRAAARERAAELLELVDISPD